MNRKFTISSKFAKDLKKSLEEAIAHKEGKLDLYSEYIEIPEPPAEYRNKKDWLTKSVVMEALLQQ